MADLAVWWLHGYTLDYADKIFLICNTFFGTIPVYPTSKFFGKKNRQISKIGKTCTPGFSDMLNPNMSSVFQSEAYMRHFYQDHVNFTKIRFNFNFQLSILNCSIFVNSNFNSIHFGEQRCISLSQQ